MTAWILSVGSTDVKLNTQNNWHMLHRQVRSEIKETNKQFSPTEEGNRRSHLWCYPSRALGLVYGRFIDDFYPDLDFSLWDSLRQALPSVSRTIVLLTDQSAVFAPPDKNSPSCPFWKDTCTLKPIIDRYFHHNLPESKVEYLTLKPDNCKGLEDWNSVFMMVEKSLSSIYLDTNEQIYVSHQSVSTTVSCAVQFVALQKFSPINLLTADKSGAASVLTLVK